MALATCAAASCYGGGNGLEPEDTRLYFPSGVALSRSGKFLFVLNSDFDLRYNAGTLQALSLGNILAQADECKKQMRALGTGKLTVEERQTLAQACRDFDASKLVRASVRLGAFASDVLVTAPREWVPGSRDSGAPKTTAAPLSQGRLLMPVRGDATLSIVDYIESDDGSAITLRCSTNARPNVIGASCDPSWRKGNNAADNSRQMVLPGEPFSVAANERWTDDAQSDLFKSGGVAAVVHQNSGFISAFVGVAGPFDSFAEDSSPPNVQLAYSLGGLAGGGTSITALDLTPAEEEHPLVRFLVTNRTRASLQVVQFGAEPVRDRSSLFANAVIPYPTQWSGIDSRDVIVDPPNVDPEDPTKSEQRETRVFVSNRSPTSLIIGVIDPQTKNPRFYDSLPLPIGASRLARVVIDEGDGPRTRILASAFDSQRVVIFDPDLGIVRNVVSTQKGPSAMATPKGIVRRQADPGASAPAGQVPYAIVANFTDSTLQLIDLDPGSRGTATYEQIVLTVGVPSAPKQ